MLKTKTLVISIKVIKGKKKPQENEGTQVCSFVVNFFKKFFPVQTVSLILADPA